jgi:hypothetical protein
MGTKVKWKDPISKIEYNGVIAGVGKEGVTVDFNKIITEVTHCGNDGQEGKANGDVNRSKETYLFFDFPVNYPIKDMLYIDSLEVADV